MSGRDIRISAHLSLCEPKGIDEDKHEFLGSSCCTGLLDERKESLPRTLDGECRTRSSCCSGLLNEGKRSMHPTRHAERMDKGRE